LTKNTLERTRMNIVFGMFGNRHQSPFDRVLIRSVTASYPSESPPVVLNHFYESPDLLKVHRFS